MTGLERLLTEPPLLGPLRYTPPQTWAAAGADEDFARRLWRAMGFADVPDDEVAFTDADVEMLRSALGWIRNWGVDQEAVVRNARLFGQTLGRVVENLVVAMRTGVAEIDDAAEVQKVAQDLIERQLLYIFRRHQLQAARRLSGAGEVERSMAVGFADVVNFTRLSGELPEAELDALLDDFEREAQDVISIGGGRVVKLIGDAVLFAVDDPYAAVRIALELVGRFGGDRPQLRAGLATGPVLLRQGDVFGTTVNLASRLVGFARPGTVLAGGDLGALLAERDDFTIRKVRARELKGLGHTDIVVVRPPAE